MITIIQALLPLFLRLIGMALDKGEYTKEQRESFVAFALSMQKSQTVSAEIHNSYEEQIEKLKKKVMEEKHEL